MDIEDRVHEIEREMFEIKYQIAELKNDLNDLLKLDLAAEIKEMKHWLKYLIKQNPPPK
jgi:regulator of replication initiation timing